MSHIVQIETKAHDQAAIGAACRRLGLAEPVQGTATFSGSEITGLLLRLPDWDYPAVIDTTSGVIRYDNYEGQWGEQRHLDAFLQSYAVEKAKLEARKTGQAVSEETLVDGSIKLSIQVA